jgi:pimeloyl-ACP methyl ester carboxylesterase
MPPLLLDGRALETRVIPGDATKPWLVFLHEGLGSVSLWRDVPDVLARRLGWPALVYSRFGYGSSARLQGPRPVTFMHAEAREVLPRVLDQLGIARSLLVGHSDGASIALIRAADAPADTVGVVAMAPHVMVETGGLAEIARVRDRFRTDPDFRLRLARHHVHVDDAVLGWANVWLDPGFRAWSLAPEVARLQVPTLLIQGTDDAYGTLDQLSAIVSGAPATTPVQQVVLDACGHSPHRDQREAVLDAISGFVARLPVTA